MKVLDHDMLDMLCPSVVSGSATPWTIAYQAPLSMGFSPKESWSGQPFPSLEDLSKPGIKPRSLDFQANSFTI